MWTPLSKLAPIFIRRGIVIMSHGRNYECCSFCLHGMLQNVKIVTTRPGLPYMNFSENDISIMTNYIYIYYCNNVLLLLKQWRIQGGGRNRRAHPLKLDRLWIFYNPFCIRMLKNRAQIALESIKIPRASRALKRALDPCRKGLRIWRS